jgi:hypothetical protein
MSTSRLVKYVSGKQRRASRQCPAVHRESDSEGGVVTSVTMSSTPQQKPQNKPISEPTPASLDTSTTCDATSRNTSASAAPEIFHPVYVGARRALRDVVAKATTPLEDKEGG